MAFWGIEIKAGKPFNLSPNKRLRISQATLDSGSSNKKSLVQCNVGKKTPIMLCALLPGRSESCHLDLEFEETKEVTFSVIGSGKVYLSGYFISNMRHNLACDDESESYGEDIGETESEWSKDESEYENDGFIVDDSDPLLFSPSSSSSLEYIRKKRNATKKRLKKTYELSESDEDGQHKFGNNKIVDYFKSDDEDEKNKYSLSRRTKLSQKNSKRKRQDVSGNDDHSLEDKEMKKKKRKNNKEKEDSMMKTVGEKNGRTWTISAGLVIEDLEHGQEAGEVASLGNKVAIHYTGKLKKGGKIFDSTIGKAPLKFRLGKNQVINGLELGVEGMRVGSKRRLHIPPTLGFGSEGSDRVSPYSWLIMDVELVQVYH